MEDEVHEDQAVILEVMHKLVNEFTDDFFMSQVEKEKKSIVDHIIFVLVAFLATL